MHSLRWNGVARQSFDYSCGTGSIVNLMSLYGVKGISERELLRRYSATRSKDQLLEAQREGFSLLDIHLMLAMIGYDSDGVRYEAGTLPDELKPMIVYLVVKGYRHFAVFAGIDHGQIILLDPARGRIRIGLPRFLSEWDGSALTLNGVEAQTKSLTGSGDLTQAQETARSAVVER
ncbi:MAG TPA: cysteine peptidase family C39 domain-containing protein [Lacunisphaera sp.]